MKNTFKRLGCLLLALVLVVGLLPVQTRAYSISEATIYFEKPDSWTANTVQMMIGHSSWSAGYAMTLVEGNIYKYTHPANDWNDAKQIAIFNTAAVWGGEANNITHRKAYADASTSVITLTSSVTKGKNYVIAQVNGVYKLQLMNYTVSFDANGGSGSMDSATGNDAPTYTLPTSCDFTAPEGKVFAGWALTVDGDVITDTTITTISDTTLYAQWIDDPNAPVEYTVTFNGTNVTSDGASTVEAGSDYIATLTAADGYTLPETVTVTVGGDEIDGFTYTDGIVTIPASSINGDIVITAVGKEKLPETKTIYLNAGGSGLWDQASAWFAAKVDGTVYKMVDLNLDGVYEVEIPYEATQIMFLRKDPANTNLDESAWNKTATLTIGGNCYTITGWGDNDGTWSDFTPSATEAILTVAGETGLCGTNWDTTNTSNDMTLNASGIYEKVFTNVAAGTYKFKVALNHSWDKSWGDTSTADGNAVVTVDETGSTVTITFDPATQKVVATVEAPAAPTEYTVTFNGTNVTSNGAGTITEGEDYTATLTAAEGYTLPESVSVKIGETDVAHTYADGVLTIEAANITGDIVITAVGVEEETTMTVYFQNNWLWTDVCVYYWGSTTDTNPTWPGVAMTFVENDGTYDIYSAEVPKDITGMLFNGIKDDGSGNRDQSPDIEGTSIVSESVCYYMTWSDGNQVGTFEYDPNGGGSGDSGDGYYLVGYINGADYDGNDYQFADGSLTVTFTADSYVLLKDSNDQHYIPDAAVSDATTATLKPGNWDYDRKVKVLAGTYTFTLVENADGSLTLSYAASQTDPTDNVTYEATFHFANTLGWGAVNLYTWTAGGANPTGSWPGSGVGQDADGFYTATVTFTAPAGQGLNFIFNNGGAQTVDLALAASDFTLDSATNTYKAEKWIVLTTQTDSKYNADILDSGDSIAISPKVDGTSVTFQYKAPNASAVEVRGTMCGWEDGKGVSMSKNEYGIWSVTVSNVTPGQHEYKFVVDGEWVTDPCNGWQVNGNSAFTVLDPNAVDNNQITVRMHYYRADGSYDGWNIWLWSQNMGGKQYDFADVDGEKVASVTVDGRNVLSVSFIPRLSVEGNEWKAQEATYVVDLSDIVSGTIDYYVTAGNATGTRVLNTDVVKATKLSSVELDYANNTIVITAGSTVADPMNEFGIVNLVDGEDDIAIESISSSGNTYTLTLNKTLDLVTLYQYKIKFGGYPYDIGIDDVYATDKFAAEYTYAGEDLGANYYASGTTFRVWAPTAEEVSVNLYTSGTAGTDDLIQSVPMSKDVNGTWVVTVEGDQNGVYYTYQVKVNGEIVEAVDPYARTTGVNGNRGMVIDLDSTDPADGWTEISDKPDSYTDAVIYELHVRDFSIDDSSGVKDAWQGKFLGLTQTGTTTENGATTGLDYLKNLGITHVHLLPVYDYASVDETTCTTYNWGYDPQNYNTPEGSYSTDPYNGATRVKEMKEMVDTLHENGIGVIMDVVYNHVYNADTFCFNQIVPGYFSRVDSNTSGCGNDTASEREMVRKYIVESVLYWAEEYHIDGFRFDLVGLLDVETINQIVKEVHEYRSDIIFYGEGWDMDGTNNEEGTDLAKQGNASKTPGFAYFSDSMRNGLAGNNGSSLGFVSGSGNGASMITEWLANPWWTKNPEQVVQYVSCHDNYTLADKLIISTGASGVTANIIKMNNLAAAFYMTAQGIPFIHAGEEILREKLNSDGSRNHNSYNSSDSVNHIEWSNLDKETYAANAEYYKGLIAFRKAHPALRYDTATEVAENVQTLVSSGKVIAMQVDGYGADDDDIIVIFNAGTSATSVTLPDGTWTININGTKAGTTSLGTASCSVSVPAISAMVLTKPDEGKDAAVPAGPSEEKTLYFSNNKGWEKVYAYAWTDGGEKLLLGDWPGTEMTYVETNDYGEKIYSITLPASATGIEGVIFTDGSSQTVDIEPGIDGTGYYCTDQNDEGKYEVGTYTYRAPNLGTASEYFLVGYINGADYLNGDYQFDENGKITVTFTDDSYVYVVNGTNTETYKTNGYQGAVNTATLYDISKHQLTGTQWDKLLIPGGVEVTITMVKNADNTVTLSYELENVGVEDTSGIQDGVTLHCWNWSFQEIEENMATIAAMGYTAIQTSPVQPLKEATTDATDTVGGVWWLYYQPVDFVITTDDGNALGTKADLESMIETAHRYGVKVIVDVVANHLGNQTGNDLSNAIPEYLKDEAYWHDISKNISSWDDREDMTQNCLDGLPDLNTANDDIQGYVLAFLKECVDIGVDGFRFDMAKSIETPMDDSTFASDFWPTVVGGAESYAQEQYGKDLYIYGEVLDDAKIAIGAYTQYMAVTDNGWGNHLRTMIAGDSATMVSGYYKSASASNLVIWAESHDTYASQSSSGVSEEDINKTWALVAARANAMGLYLARPESLNQALGVASLTGWDNPEVKAANKFHNAFHGESEAIGNENGFSYVVRGTSGVVLVNVSSSSNEVSVDALGMADGTYTDQITGNTFTVANGKITGTMGSTGIAVVYNVATYTVEVEDTTGGTVVADKETAEAGETVTLTVTAAEGKEIDTVTVTDAAGNQVTVTDNGDGTYTFTQPESEVTVTVTFKDAPPAPATKYDVTFSAVTGGTVVADKETAEAGETVTLTVTAAEGKTIDAVTVTDAAGNQVTVTNNGDGTYTFIQPESEVTVTVTFKDVTSVPSEEYQVTVKESISGTVEISNQEPTAGTVVTVTPVPHEGVKVESVIVKDENGAQITVTKNQDGTYSFVQPEGDVTVEVVFKPDYKIIKGDGSSAEHGSDTALSFTANGAFEKFTGIKVDGQKVDAKHYDAKSGSTVITLKASFLQTLDEGEHTITVIYTDGEATGTFSLKKEDETTAPSTDGEEDETTAPSTDGEEDETTAPSTDGEDDETTAPSTGDEDEVPPTGDSSSVMLWTSAMTVSLLGLAILILDQKKRSFTK